jgi:hypothetical protein
MTENNKEFYSVTPYETKCSGEAEINQLIKLAAINYKQIRDLNSVCCFILLSMIVYFLGTITGNI